MRDLRLIALSSACLALASIDGCSLATHFGSFSSGDGGDDLDTGEPMDVTGDVPRDGSFDAPRDATGDLGEFPDVPADGGGVDGGGGFVLTVVPGTGGGTGAVSADMGAIACGAACSDSYAPGTRLVLTVAADSDSVFTGWGGDCSGTMPFCLLTMDRDHTVSANFDLRDFDVTVVRSGDGTGTVMGGPINCGSTCTASLPAHTMLTLAAASSGASTFTGWAGPCTGTGDCTFEVLGDEVVTASFDIDRRSLNVMLSGTAIGVVSSAPGGIDCGTDCSESYLRGTPVTLTALPAPNADFAGWSGACSGTGTCMVTMDDAANVTARFNLRRYALTVARAGTGMGDVISLPAGGPINCGSTCTTTQDHGSTIVLQAVERSGSTFDGWSGGGCSGNGVCTVTLTEATTVTANFSLIDRMLQVVTVGSGSVTSAPAGITCGSTCTATFGHGTNVMLTAFPAVGQEFVMWTGDCSGTTPTCSVSMVSSRTVTATFRPTRLPLTVTRNGAGMGSVAGTGIGCGMDCDEPYDFGTMVTLTATPVVGSTFAGWGGDCSGIGTCVVTMTAAANVTATFVLGTSILRVVKAGAGDGTVTSAPAGISCGATCAAGYSFMDMVTLTAAPSAGSTFVGWSGGGCSGTGTCVVTIGAGDTEVTATFAAIPRTLAVMRMGAGTVTSVPAGISCGGDCGEAYANGTVVRLTAMADPSTSFTGWSGGGCSGTGPCDLTLTADVTVVATFTLNNYLVNVTRGGGGTGTVTSTPLGINCGSDCSQTYSHGTALTLTATPDAGNMFVGWLNVAGCSTSAICSTSVTAPLDPVASFAPIQHVLTVMRSGGGMGTVQASDGTIDCGSTCSASYPDGTFVTLTATPVSGSSVFTGWTDPTCAPFGTGPCVLTMSAATTVTAQFLPLHRVTVTVNGSSLVPHALDVVQDGSYLGACSVGTCTYFVPAGANLEFTSGPTPSYWPFASWAGACAGVLPSAPCTRTITGPTSIIGNFQVTNIAFVTSSLHDGAFGATAAAARTAANAICNGEAMAAGLPGTYVAWLSQTTAGALAQLGTSTIWVRPDGSLFSNHVGTDSIGAGRIVHPLALDATGADLRSPGTFTPELRVWTGAGVNGTTSMVPPDDTPTCGNWTMNGAGVTGTAGSLERTAGGWTAHEQNTPCSTAAHLYCFSTGLTPPGAPSIVAVPPRRSMGDARGVIFLAAARDGSSLSAMDAQCASAATASDLPAGTYLAFLGTPMASAMDRVTFAGPWVRPDGFFIADRFALEGMTPLSAPPTLNAAGAVYANRPSWPPMTGISPHELWTGMGTGSTGRPPPTMSCSAWTTTIQTGAPFGDASSSLATVGMGWQTEFSASAPINNCHEPHSYYCIRAN